MADNSSSYNGSKAATFLSRAKEWADACEFTTISEMLSALIDRNPQKIATAFKNLFTSVGKREKRSFKDRYGVDVDDLYTEVILSSSSSTPTAEPQSSAASSVGGK